MLEPIPEELLTQLMRAKPILANSGSVSVRRESDRGLSIRLRYRNRDPQTGKVRQASIAGPSWAAVSVTQLIQHWRSSRQAELVKARVWLADHYNRRKQEQRERRTLLEPHKANRRLYRRLRDEHDRIMAGDDDYEKLSFVWRSGWMQPPARRGRPPEKGTW